MCSCAYLVICAAYGGILGLLLRIGCESVANWLRTSLRIIANLLQTCLRILANFLRIVCTLSRIRRESVCEPVVNPSRIHCEPIRESVAYYCLCSVNPRKSAVNVSMGLVALVLRPVTTGLRLRSGPRRPRRSSSLFAELNHL